MCKLMQQAVSAIIKQGRIYEVGGIVRDRLLGKTGVAHDRDYLVTGIPYEDLSKILKPHGQLNLVGKSFGVIKFTQKFGEDYVTFDISLPRTEYSTGSGHKDFEVNYNPELKVEDDLARRDFTVNAMAWDLESDTLIDPLNGRSDLDAGLIKIVYPQSFKDDPLRILRAVQFAARFNFEIDPETYQRMCENVSLITTVSPERIAEELNKLLTLSVKPSIGFNLMESCGMLKLILPELQACKNVDQPGGFHKYDVYEHTMVTIDSAANKLSVRLAALFHDINKPQAKRTVDKGATFYGHEVLAGKTAKKVLKRLRYSNEMISEVQTLVERHMFTTDVTPKGMRRLVKRAGIPLIFDLLDLRRADIIAQGMGGTYEDVDQFEQDIRDELDKKSPFSLSDIALDGKFIMEKFNIGEGPMVGKVLDYLMDQVLDDPENNTAEKLEELAINYYSKINDDKTLINKETNQ